MGPKSVGARRVLSLNASYEPICTVSWQRAIVLVLENEAEVLEEGDEVVRSQWLTLVVPKVIRLLSFRDIPFKVRSPLSRRAVLARDTLMHGPGCCYCKRKADTIDHVIPRALKGQHAWLNVVAACKKCNGFKADRLLADVLDDPNAKKIGFGPPRFEARMPEGVDALRVSLHRSYDPVFERYLVPA